MSFGNGVSGKEWSVFLAKRVTLVTTADQFLIRKHSQTTEKQGVSAHSGPQEPRGMGGAMWSRDPAAHAVLSPSGTETSIVRGKEGLEGNKRSVCNQQFLNLPA